MEELKNIIPTAKDGKERLYISTQEEVTDIRLLDFWKWSMSDLLSNATRGILAEFIVAKALDIDTSNPRNEWGPYDLITKDGIKIEVKSAAYIQSWYQKDFSKISFSIKKTRHWNEKDATWSEVKKRQADVYVFCLLHHKDQETIDPLDLDQWSFFILSSRELDNYSRSQHSITLKSLKELFGSSIRYNNICNEINSMDLVL